MWDSLKKRIIPGLSFAAIIVSAIYFSPWTYALIMLLIILLCTHEFFKIIKAEREPNDVLADFHGIAVSIYICAIFIAGFLERLTILPTKYLSIAPFAFLLILFLELFSKSSKPLYNIGLNVMGLLYIGIPIFMSNYIIQLSNTETGILYDGRILLGAMLLVMLNDVGAYFMGNWFGKHPLFTRVSPKKTIEGTVGGYLTNLIGGVLGFYIIGQIPLLDWLIIAVLSSTGAIIGDLVESLFKRSLQIKDSGSAIPGHGGFLDRFDAILYSLPIIATYIILRF